MPIAAEELEPLLMRRLRVNRGGPDAAEGMLVGVMADYFALLLPTGDVVYIVNRHVKSVTDQSDRPGNRVRQAPAVAQVPFFEDLLRALVGRPVQINRGGPEKIAGVIHGVTGSSVILRSGSEFVLVRLGHIRSLQILRGRQANWNYQSSQNSQSSQNNRNSQNRSSRNGQSRRNNTGSQSNRAGKAQNGKKGKSGGGKR